MATIDPTPQTPLNREEKAQARVHWLDLMFASSTDELDAARQALALASPRIQSSIMTAYLDWSSEEKELTPEETPFDEMD